MKKLVSWVAGVWAKFWDPSPELRIYRATMLLAILVGIFLRLRGFLFDASSFWLDEAHWTVKMYERTLLNMVIRPIAFMWLSRTIADTFGPTEFWLRLVPNVASIVTLLLIPYLATQILSKRVFRLLLVILFALQPALLDYAKEFKPYSLEVLLHLIPILLYLRYRETKRRGFFYAFLISLPVLFPLGYNVCFTYPGCLLLALWKGYQERGWKGTIPAVATGAFCLVMLGGFYSLILNRATSEGTTDYWGRKYDVFYEPQHHIDTGKSRLQWFSQKYAELASLPGLRRDLWRPARYIPEIAIRALKATERFMWVTLHLIGIYYLLRSRRDEFLLFCVPIAVVIVLNLVGQWPFGAFRTNVFLCAYMLPIPMMGVDYLAGESQRRMLILACTIWAMTLVPGFAFGFDWKGRKHFWGAREHQHRELLGMLREERLKHLAANPQTPRERLIMDCQTWHSHRYYLKFHPETKAQYGNFFAKNFLVESWCGDFNYVAPRIERRLRTNRPIWVIVSKAAYMQQTEQFAESVANVELERRFGRNHLVMLLSRR